MIYEKTQYFLTMTITAFKKTPKKPNIFIMSVDSYSDVKYVHICNGRLTITSNTIQ